MNLNNKISNQDYEIQLNEGIFQAKKGNYDRASKSFLKLIRANKENYKAYINLSNIYILKNQINLCLELLFNYLDKYKFNENIANHLAKICLEYNLINDIKKLFKITKLEKTNYKKEKKYLYFFQGLYFEKLLKFNEAINSYEKSILCDSNNLDASISLLSLLESTNKIEKFNKILNISLGNFEKTEELNIFYFFKCLILNRQKKYIESEKLIKDKNLFIKLKKTNFYFRLLDLRSKNNNKLKNYKEAFESVETRNKLLLNLKKNKIFDRNKILDTIDQYKNFYNKTNVNRIKKNLNNTLDKNLVFLVGFPRSGTTLLDSILRTHSKISVLEEKTYLLDARHNYFKENNNNLNALLDISESKINEIRESYFNKININKNNPKGLIIDKLPLSIIELGFINCIFPKAKIILALRHPCDVITSCFFSSFKINDAMVNFLDWNHTISFYNKVFDLFEFYEKELELICHKIKYEDVVYKFKDQIVSLLNFLELKYEDEMENFNITALKRNKISTPSYNQVINPLYQTSIGRWKNYLELKNPEKELTKWIKTFNY